MSAKAKLVNLAQVLMIVFVCFCVVGSGGCENSSDPAPEADERSLRIVALSPGLASTLRAIGHGDQLVARHGFDSWSDASLPVAGDQAGIDAETLVVVDPDVVILEATAQPTPERLVRLAERYGWRVVRVPVLRLDEVRASIGVLDRLARGVEADAPLSGGARSALESWDVLLGPEGSGAVMGDELRLGRVVSLLHLSPIGVAGPGSFSAELVERLGGVSLPREGLAYQSLMVEDLATLGADTVIVYTGGVADAEWSWERLRDRSIGAVDAGRVIVVDHEAGLLPSVQLAEVAAEIADRASGLASLVERGEATSTGPAR